MASKWIVGAGDALDAACDAWQSEDPTLQIHRVAIGQDALYQFDLSPLDGVSAGKGTAFAAFDERFGNFKRTELMVALMGRGFRLEPFVSRRAMVAANVVVGRNAFIGDGVIVGAGSRIDYNSVLMPGAQLGARVHVRPSCWLESGVVVGSGARIGAHSILRMGAQLSPGVQVGRSCELGWARRYDHDIPSRTTFDPRYDAPIHVYG